MPPQVFAAFAGVDFILHAGDLVSENVLTDLEAIAPTFGVHGNCDEWDVLDKLPATRFLTVEKCNIGIVHGHIAGGVRVGGLNVSGNAQTAGNALSHFLDDGASTVDCVIFGHSHNPIIHWHAVADRKILLLNPGSPTDRRTAPNFSVGMLRVDGATLSPELLTW